MLRAGADRGPHATEMEAVQRFREFVRPLSDSPRAPVRQAHVLVHGGEVPSEGDVPFLQVDADAGGLERAASGVHLVGVVAEEGEVARVAAGDDPRGDRVDEPIHPIRREPVEVRSRRRFERGLVPQLGERPIPQPIEDDEEDPPFIHVDAR